MRAKHPPLDPVEVVLWLGAVAALVLWFSVLLGCQPAPARPDRATPVEVRTVPCPNSDGDCYVLEPRLPRGEP